MMRPHTGEVEAFPVEPPVDFGGGRDAALTTRSATAPVEPPVER